MTGMKNLWNKTHKVVSFYSTPTKLKEVRCTNIASDGPDGNRQEHIAILEFEMELRQEHVRSSEISQYTDSMTDHGCR